MELGWIDIVFHLVFLILLIIGIFELATKRSKIRKIEPTKEKMGILLLKVDIPTSIFNEKFFSIIFNLVNVFIWYYLFSQSNFGKFYTIEIITLFLISLISTTYDFIVIKPETEIREKGIYSKRVSWYWKDFDYYFWERNKVVFRSVTQILFKYTTFNTLVIKPEQKLQIDALLRRYILKKS